jgi:hypothetical protein
MYVLIYVCPYAEKSLVRTTMACQVFEGIPYTVPSSLFFFFFFFFIPALSFFACLLPSSSILFWPGFGGTV